MLERLHRGVLLLATTFLIGVAGFLILGGPGWSLLDAIYMTAITLTTVGYGEIHDLSRNPAARMFGTLFLIGGYGTVLYVSATFTAFLVEGDLHDYFRRRKMRQAIGKLSNHYIVCGAGETGQVVIAELLKTGHAFVVIEQNTERAHRLAEHYGDKVAVLTGDATEDEVLLEAGIERARGMMIALESDKDAVFVTLTARNLNRDLRIVAKGLESSSTKLMKAGADSVVSPNFIGGMRIASEMLRPTVVGFLDAMLRDPTQTTRFEQVAIARGSSLAGRTLQEAAPQKSPGLLVVAYRAHSNGPYLYNPPPQTRLEPDGVLVVLGESSDVRKLRDAGAARPG